MTKKIAVSCISLFFAVSVSALETVKHVDLAKYLGKWEEIARFDTKHQKGCVSSQAEYTQNKGYIAVKNSCVLEDGKNKEVTGRAVVDDSTTNAKLKVNFTPFYIRMFNIGWGNYWIIELGENYDYAVVSEPKMEYLWILSRQKPMKKARYDAIIEGLKVKGFKTENLILSTNAVSAE